MSNRTNAVPPKLQAWIQARKRHRLSHAHVQMARELGMNPKKLGSIDNHRQEPWKAPLPEFIEQLYLKRFGRERPEVIVSFEERARQLEQKKAARPHGAPRQASQTTRPDQPGREATTRRKSTNRCASGPRYIGTA